MHKEDDVTMSRSEAWDAVRVDAAATLSRYVRFDTTNPPGNEAPAAAWLKEELIRRRITDDVTIYEPAPGRAVLVGRIEGRESLDPLILNHHMDVVPADPGQWSHPPFDGEIVDGYVWGRGTLDTKGLGVMHLLALEKLIQAGNAFRRPVIFLAVSDEETGGSNGMRWLVDHHLEQLHPAWVWDEGGGGFKGLLGDRSMFGIAVAEKQIQHLRLVATGQPGHGAMPHDDNANERLMRALDRILKPRPMRVNEVTAALFEAVASAQSLPRSFFLRHLDHPLVLRIVGPRLSADKRLNAMLRDTISLTTLDAGYKINVIPERAEAGIDCRLLPDTDAGEFHRWLDAVIADDQVTVERVETSAPTAVSPMDSPFFAAVRRAIARHVPDGVAFPLLVPGGTDSRYFRAHDVPAYGFTPMLLEPEELDRVHGIDERISVDNLELGVRVTCDVVRDLCIA
jgi:acetylornithine deacetylase/succinyl-diaminopimelate desuccinylase-like protein